MLTLFPRVSLSVGTFLIFPDIWKCSCTLPLHKSGTREFVKNYRDFAELSVVARIVISVLINFIKPSVSQDKHSFLNGICYYYWRRLLINLLDFVRHVFESYKNDMHTVKRLIKS